MKKRSLVLFVCVLFLLTCTLFVACDLGGKKDNIDKQKQETTEYVTSSFTSLSEDGYDLSDYTERFDDYKQDIQNASTKDELDKIRADFDAFVQQIKNGESGGNNGDNPVVTPGGDKGDQGGDKGDQGGDDRNLQEFIDLKQQLLNEVNSALSSIKTDYEGKFTEFEEAAVSAYLASAIISIENSMTLSDLNTCQRIVTESKQYAKNVAADKDSIALSDAVAATLSYADYLWETLEKTYGSSALTEYQRTFQFYLHAIHEVPTEGTFLDAAKTLASFIEATAEELEKNGGSSTIDPALPDDLTEMRVEGKRNALNYWYNFVRDIGDEKAAEYKNLYEKCIAEIDVATSNEQIENISLNLEGKLSKIQETLFDLPSLKVDAKENATKTWNQVQDSLSQSDVAKYQQIYEKFLEDIEAATTLEEANSLISDFSSSFNALADAQNLEEVKKNAKTSATNKYNNIIYSDFYDDFDAEQQKSCTEAYEKFLKDIEAATTTEQVDNLEKAYNEIVKAYNEIVEDLRLSSEKARHIQELALRWESLTSVYGAENVAKYQKQYETYLSTLESINRDENRYENKYSQEETNELLEEIMALVEEINVWFEKIEQELISQGSSGSGSGGGTESGGDGDGAINPDDTNKHVHEYSEEWIIDVAATCTSEGYMSHHCKICDDKTDVTILAKIEHNYVGGVCTVCGDVTGEGGTVVDVDAYRQPVLRRIEMDMQGEESEGKFTPTEDMLSKMKEFYTAVNSATTQGEIDEIAAKYEAYYQEIWAELEKQAGELEEYKGQVYDEVTNAWEATIKDYETPDPEWSATLEGYKASYNAQINGIWNATTKAGVDEVKKELDVIIENTKAYIATIEYANEVKEIVWSVWNRLSQAMDTTTYESDYENFYVVVGSSKNKNDVNNAIEGFFELIEIVESRDVTNTQYYAEYVMEKMYLNWYLLAKDYVDGTSEYLDEYSKLVDEVKMLTDCDVSGATNENIKEKVATIYAKFEALIVKVKNYKPTTAA